MILYFKDFIPEDTGRKLNVHKNVLCTFNLRPVSTGTILNAIKGRPNEIFLYGPKNICANKAPVKSEEN